MRIDDELKIKYEKLGQNIREYRENKKITMQELAQKTGIREKFLERIENGTAVKISICKHLEKIADCLNIKISDLLKGI